MLRYLAPLIACTLILLGTGAQAADKPASDPFIEYESLAASFSTLDDATVKQFIEDHKAAYVSNIMRGKWLTRLASQGRWQEFDEYYSDAVRSKKLECYALKRRIARDGISDETDERIQELWMTWRTRPYSCTPVFKKWKKAGKMTDEQLWGRFKLVINKDKKKLAHSLAKIFLPAADRIWIDHWITMRKNPKKSLAAPGFPLDSDKSIYVIADGLEQIARKDPHAAEATWKNLVEKSPSLKKYAPQAYAVIGYRAAVNHWPDSSRFLRKAAFNEERVRQWAIRGAARNGDWNDLLYFYEQLSDDEKADVDWRYWKARALEVTGKKKAARKIYKEIANEREYYSFLAADRIGAKYEMNNQEVKAKTKALAKQPAFKLVKKLKKEGDLNKVRRQWEWATHDLEGEDLQAAAKLAYKWGLYDRAIFTVARAKFYDDLKLRFPTLYKDIVRQEAEKKQLPLAYVYGIMRQESAFMQEVRSSAGALGLMQIMPGTGKVIARKQKKSGFHSSQLKDPDTNIDMGTFYLRDMLDRFGGNYAMATAAYNAGPLRPPRWQGANTLEADVWIESIPFNETRKYVKKVMMYKAIYDHLLKQKQEPLSKLLAPIPGKG